METKVVMPRLGVNDDTVVLVQWRIKEGAWVKKGETVAVIETSKETSEIIAEAEGVITFLVQEGEEVEVGGPVAVISETQQGRHKPAEEKESRQYRITEKARELVRQYNIDLSLFPANKLIKEKDVLNLVRKPYEITKAKHNKFLIYGGGAFAKVIIDILKTTPACQIHGIVDSHYPEAKEVMGVPVVGNDDDLKRLYEEGYHYICNSIGFKNNVHWRKPVYEKLKKFGFLLSNVIHSRAVIEPSVSMEEGNIVCAGAVIGSQASIGSNCIINAGAVISHDCIISDHCHIASGAVLAGNVVVGENTLIGQGCTVYADVKIGKNAVIQNGCHIFKNIADNEIVKSGQAGSSLR